MDEIEPKQPVPCSPSMDAMNLYDNVCKACSVLATKSYSTSFSMGIRFLSPALRQPIYSIYGFVRFADEIVDSEYWLWCWLHIYPIICEAGNIEHNVVHMRPDKTQTSRNKFV